MPHVLTTKDGKNHTVIDEADILSLVEDYAGYDIRVWLEEWLTEQRAETQDALAAAKETEEEIDSLRDHHREVLSDMYEEASWLMKLTGEYRPKRSDIRECTEKIWNVLAQEI